MTFLRTHRGRLIFHVGGHERLALERLLQRYPLIPSGHHRISRKSPPPGEDHQALLDEGVAEQREASRRKAREFIEDRSRFRKVGEGYRLSLSATEAEWLLQVLNDIRVGSWLRLGEPENLDELPSAENELQEYHWIMNLAGFFQCALLEAQGGFDTHA